MPNTVDTPETEKIQELYLTGCQFLIKADEVEKVSKGGIFIPEKSQESFPTGTVKAVGPETWDVWNPRSGKRQSITVGDKVFYKGWAAKGSGTCFKINGEEHIIIAGGDILALVVDTPKSKKSK